MNHWLREQALRLLRLRGYELKEVGSPLRGFDWSLKHAVARGLEPKTVFDVGVGNGTPWLYDAFPQAKLVLFEPATAFERDLQTIEQQRGADVHRVALSDRVGKAKFHFNSNFPTSSSLLTFDPQFKSFALRVQGEHVFEDQWVDLAVLDDLNRYDPPFVLKLDVEGAETAVLRGATRTLTQTELLIIEISVMRRQREESSFAEMIALLDALGFELFDIPSLSQTNTGTLIYLDAVFVPKGSSLWPT